MIDNNFIPAAVWVREFLKTADEKFCIGIERDNGIIEQYKTKIQISDINKSCFYIERTVKTMLWIFGGYRIYLCGNKTICDYIKNIYSKNGSRIFDAEFMSDIYGRKFEVIACENIPQTDNHHSGIHINTAGNRIAIDLGGSFIKVCAVSGDNIVYKSRTAWAPSIQTDIDYHHSMISEALMKATDVLQPERIIISSAGIHINNSTRIASLFRNVKDKGSVSSLFSRIAGEIPLTVINDGDAAAVYGMIKNNRGSVLGISIGTSEAGGYIDKNGKITGRLNEFAFVPIDFSSSAKADKWSEDIGCGSEYLSQSGVVSLAPQAGIALNPELTLSEKCFEIQKLVSRSAHPAIEIYDTIGEYLGFALAYYNMFFNFDRILLTGGVVSGAEKDIVINSALKTISKEFPQLHIEAENSSDSYINQAYAASCLSTAE